MQSSKSNYLKNTKANRKFDDEGYTEVEYSKKKISRFREKFDKRNFDYTLESK